MSTKNSNGEKVNHGYDNPAVELDQLQTAINADSKYSGKGPRIDECIVIPSSENLASSKDSSCVQLDVALDEKHPENSSIAIQAILATRAGLTRAMVSQRHMLKAVFLTLLTIAYFIYFGFAMAMNWEAERDFCHGAHLLFILTIIVGTGVVYFCVIKRFFGKAIDRNFVKPFSNSVDRMWQRPHVRWIVYALLVGAVAVFLAVDSANSRQRLVSAAGVLTLTFIGFLFSKHPGHIVWRQVFWGLGLQFIFALMILRWNTGREIFQCLGDKVSYFLNFSDQGATFVYGYLVTGKLNDWTSSSDNSSINSTLPFDGKLPLQPAIFAFKILPTIFFFSSCISILYYYGVMQWVIAKLGWLLQVTVGTTAAESMNAAANIFVGQTEAPLVIQPFLPLMTKSELHAVMTGGFATIAGGVLAAYINFGISASHLLSASVMSAPAALGFSKLFYPETETSNTTASNVKLDKGSERNALEAAANGAVNATFLVANIVANLIAFIALIGFINFTFSWFGSLVGWHFLSFEWILSKLFIPLAFMMGVDASECELVAKLIGLKTVVNEFVAYAELATMLKNNQLSPRAEAIATYALCGFSNLSSLGVTLGGLGAMAPQRRSDLAEVALRGLIAGSIACFLTACIAGTLIDAK